MNPLAAQLDVDGLAQFIRIIDGNNTMGAGELAEHIATFLQERSALRLLGEGKVGHAEYIVQLLVAAGFVSPDKIEQASEIASKLATPALDEDAVRAGVLSEVLAEVGRAIQKFPTWPTDPLHALAVLGEEYGELVKEALQLVYEPHKTSAAEVRKEAIQTAAMALRWVNSIDRYEYARGEQHEQEPLEAAP